MGCGASRDVIASAPEELIPDPPEGAGIMVTIKQTATMSRDYTVYRGLETKREHSWFFLNKSGSKWGGQATAMHLDGS